MAISVIWLNQNSPICPALPDSLWDSHGTPRKNQTCQNVKHSKTPNAIFQIGLQFPRTRSCFTLRSARYRMRVVYINVCKPGGQFAKVNLDGFQAFGRAGGAAFAQS